MVDAIFFDLDGTLADTREDIARSLNHALGRLGRPPLPLERVKRIIGDGFRTLLERALDTTDPGPVEEGLAVFAPHYLEHCADHTILYPGVRETLERLSSKKLAVVTNKPQAHTRAILKVLAVNDFFREILAGDSLPVRKPKPEPLLEAARRLGVEPGRTLMVGDSPGDIQAGKAAGSLTCGVTFGYRAAEEIKAAGPDFIVSEFAQLFELARQEA